jgi:hypothetical protein
MATTVARSVKVFLSSTRATLEDERDALYTALSGDYEVIRMENFGSRGTAALETCLDELEGCDVCVTLLGHRYGSIVPRYNASYTETEYEHARVSDVEVLAYVKADFEASLAGSDNPVRLKESRDSLRRGLTVQEPEFSGIDEFVDRVKADLEGFKTRPRKRPLFRDRVGALADPSAYGNGSWRHERLALHPYPVIIVELPVMRSEVYPAGRGRRLQRKVLEVFNETRKIGAGAVVFNSIPVPSAGPVLNQRLEETREHSAAILCLARRQSDLEELQHFAETDAQLLVWYPDGLSLPDDRPEGFYRSYTDEELQNCSVALQVMDRIDHLVSNHLAETA